MSTDKVTETLLDALKQAMAAPGEQRLFRSGKLSGIFASRTGLNVEASTQALREGLLEVVRTEIKGKIHVEWVRITPKGINFVHEHESPLRAMNELRSVLQMTREGIPAWMTDIRQTLQTLGTRLTDEVQRLTHRLESLSQRVEEALRRADAAVPQLAAEVAAAVPWGQQVLVYLERRRTSGVATPCTLAELFTSLKEQHADLSVKDYHGGLRRLREGGILRLLPFEGPNALPEPEYALLEGTAVYYYVTR